MGKTLNMYNFFKCSLMKVSLSSKKVAMATAYWSILMTSESDFDILQDIQPCIHNSNCIFVYTVKSRG